MRYEKFMRRSISATHHQSSHALLRNNILADFGGSQAREWPGVDFVCAGDFVCSGRDAFNVIGGDG